MEFEFDINPLFPSEITKLDGNLFHQESISCRRYSSSPKSNDVSIGIVIDEMGKASARAQSLHHSITTSSKLSQSDHILYVMKDGGMNEMKGVIVGILKMGRKRLFVLDVDGCQHEIIPLCVLDFYVHEAYQRQGCGGRLFEFMLQDQNTVAHNLAIDRPSEKLLAFLKKHYNLSNPIHQRNNFTVYHGIFSKKLEGIAKTDGDPRGEKYRSDERAGRNDFSSTETVVEARCLYRQSYPPSMITRGNGSVASVVFGQTVSEESHNKNKLEVDRLLQSEDPYRHGKSNILADSRPTTFDSSYNIFGVPSPLNRLSWENHE